jgi:hypothetical protein
MARVWRWIGAIGRGPRKGMPYEQALSLAEGSDEALLQSLAIIDRLGAGPLEAIVRKRLRDRGVRGVPRGPREATRSNPKGLSEKEFEVLALLVEGCSNADIARRKRSRLHSGWVFSARINMPRVAAEVFSEALSALGAPMCTWLPGVFRSPPHHRPPR